MNIANKLTISRIILIPFFVLFLFVPHPAGPIISLLIFAFACFSDLLDGYIARAKDEVTVSGKIMDPVADKILVYSGFICFIYLHIIPFWMVIVIMGRDFLVMALRVQLAAEGCVLAARNSAKLKTVLEYVALFLALIYLLVMQSSLQAIFRVSVYSATGLAAIFAIISGIQYLLEGRKILAVSAPESRTRT